MVVDRMATKRRGRRRERGETDHGTDLEMCPFVTEIVFVVMCIPIICIEGVFPQSITI